MSFKKNKYTVIRQAISKDLAAFIANYFLMQKQVYDTCKAARYFSPFETILGYYEGENEQIPNTYSSYSNIAMETLLLKCQPGMEKATGLKLYPAYTYARIYKKGDVLVRHKDRFSCEVSTTIHLGGNPWPIYLDPKAGLPVEGEYKSENNPGIKIDLDVGDMLIYSGCVLEHWREKFEGENCGQVFLHYTNKTSQGEKWKYDMRPFIGLPADFKKESH